LPNDFDPAIFGSCSASRAATIALSSRSVEAYIERLGLPQPDVEKFLHHNAQALFGFRH
jgi:hypothetical protein